MKHVAVVLTNADFSVIRLAATVFWWILAISDFHVLVESPTILFPSRSDNVECCIWTLYSDKILVSTGISELFKKLITWSGCCFEYHGQFVIGESIGSISSEVLLSEYRQKAAAKSLGVAKSIIPRYWSLRETFEFLRPRRENLVGDNKRIGRFSFNKIPQLVNTWKHQNGGGSRIRRRITTRFSEGVFWIRTYGDADNHSQNCVSRNLVGQKPVRSWLCIGIRVADAPKTGTPIWYSC